MKGSAPAGVLAKAISLASAVKRGGDGGAAHLATKGDAISITCTDQTVGTIATSASATIHEPGETAVSVERLAALLSTLAADAIVEIEATTRTINVVCGSTRIRLAAVPLVELPPAIAIAHEAGRVEISRADCLELFETLAAADAGRSRLYLAGTFWHSLNGRLVAVSTDGRRLIRNACVGISLRRDRR